MLIYEATRRFKHILYDTCTLSENSYTPQAGVHHASSMSEKSFLTVHFDLLHILEKHDSIFRIR
jgi:hypothetical protein